MTAAILTEYEDLIGTITLNQPARRNALGAELLGELLEALRDFQENGVRVAIIRGADGAKVWSSGHDITELPAGEDPLHYSVPLEKALRAIKEFPGPVIAMVHGSVWGGAMQLVLCCDIVIGDETSQFAITPANLGLPFNTTGLLDFMRRLPLNLVKEMFFTAAPIQAPEAHRWGILNHLVPVEEREAFPYARAAQTTENSPLAIAVIKEQLRLLGNSHPLSPETFERIQGLRRRAYDSADYLEGKQAFLEKRKPVFKGE